MRISIPNEVIEIINRLENFNYQAYIVGGCVRDSLMGIPPHDWDITTDARPEAVKEIFEKTVDTGLKHGTVTTIIGSSSFEITTYRIDGEYLDSRRPEAVYFTSSLFEDLSRRDFTVNAIAYHPAIGLVDPFGGVDDINKKIIKTVGNADSRFKEDALRMLRAARFSAQLDFDITEAAMSSMKRNSELILNISYERIRDELTKLLISKCPIKLLILKETDILSKILPEFDQCFGVKQNNPYHVHDVADHSLAAVSNIENTALLRWCMLLHDIAKPIVKSTDCTETDHFYGHQRQGSLMSEDILKRLKFDSKTIKSICQLILYHDLDIRPEQKAVRKAIRTIGKEYFGNWIKIRTADVLAQNPIFIDRRLEELREIYALYEQILQEGQCIAIKDLAVNGYDLINAGFKEGKEVGQLLELLLKAVIENPELNNKASLLDYVEKQ